MTASSSLLLYRQLVPAHNRVPDEVVELWLELAAQRHDAARFGAVYASAMIAWAAAHLEPQVVGGQYVAGRACAPAPAGGKPATPQVESTSWWAMYLDYRDSRAASFPTRIAP